MDVTYIRMDVKFVLSVMFHLSAWSPSFCSLNVQFYIRYSLVKVCMLKFVPSNHLSSRGILTKQGNETISSWKLIWVINGTKCSVYVL